MRAIQSLAAMVALLTLSCDGVGPTSPSPYPDDATKESISLSTASAHRLDEPEVPDSDDPGDPEDGGECARSPGFWCQNQDGRNPNLSEEELEQYLTGALSLLQAQGVQSSKEELLSGVCDTRRQLFRHLAALALNLAAGFVSASDALTGEDSALGTVGAAFEKAVAVYLMGDGASLEERNAFKDTLDRINNNVSLDNGCTPDEEEGSGAGGDAPTACALESDGKITICHVPPGNPGASQTIRISPAAWPAHEAHGDRCGTCGS